MLYISRSRSLSVRTTPLTRAMGLPDARGAGVVLAGIVLAGFTAGDGVWEETIWPNMGTAAKASMVTQIIRACFENRFVSGHGFSRAERGPPFVLGFSPCSPLAIFETLSDWYFITSSQKKGGRSFSPRVNTPAD